MDMRLIFGDGRNFLLDLNNAQPSVDVGGEELQTVLDSFFTRKCIDLPVHKISFTPERSESISTKLRILLLGWHL